ncbi:hypothetical protein GGS23DRAFT_76709 [Durotheca rogersii]|uniref:uncharacterized protein n=1 Tax=Durotheca rogersii TaxID=419775 RepID=UPI002220BAD9|nr:uncharacterized protein GGS23DRAFT_76709 [Durotheca rogersii]KAI5862952.1 hypothetical protein GGS23DRAFT_76709 [Durotheca rogersii]
MIEPLRTASKIFKPQNRSPIREEEETLCPWPRDGGASLSGMSRQRDKGTTMSRSAQEKNTPTIYSLSIMKSSTVSAYIFLACFLDRSGVSHDQHLNDFLEVLQICQRLVPQTPPMDIRLSCDIDISPSLLHHHPVPEPKDETSHSEPT